MHGALKKMHEDVWHSLHTLQQPRRSSRHAHERAWVLPNNLVTLIVPYQQHPPRTSVLQAIPFLTRSLPACTIKGGGSCPGGVTGKHASATAKQHNVSESSELSDVCPYTCPLLKRMFQPHQITTCKTIDRFLVAQCSATLDSCDTPV